MTNEYNTIYIKTFADYADSPAVITRDRQLSFRQLGQIINETTDKLGSLQIQKEEPIALLFENSLEYIVLLLALCKHGATAVPVSARWPAELIKNSLLSVQCCKIISHRKNVVKGDKKFTIVPVSRLVSPDLKNDVTNPGIVSFARNRAATIIFTSGSTGRPKAVLHSFGNHYYNALGSNENIPFSAGDRWLLTLPLYHVGGLSIVFRSLINGGTIVIPDDRKAIPENINNHKITHISLVPTQLYRLLADKKSVEKLKSLKAILLGGGAVPEQLVKKAFKYILPVYTSYGSTEMASQITTTRPGSTIDRLKTSGQALPYRELKIGPDQEIMVKGETLCLGYIQGKKVTPPVDADGWFATGDIGSIDKKGFLTVTGRKDNMFISGGENIQPEEIEKHLNNIAGIEQSLVVPVKNEEFGQRPVVFIKYKSGQPGTKDIIEQLKKHIPKFKVPDAFLNWPKEKRSGIKPDRQLFIKLAEKLLNPPGPD